MTFRILALFLLTSTTALAADISREIRQGGSSSRDGGYFELGLGVYYLESQVLGFDDGVYSRGVEVVIDGRYQWRRAFVEVVAENERGLTFGLSLIDEAYWTLDLLGSSQHAYLSGHSDQQIEGIATRDPDFMLGLRSTHSFENAMAELEYAQDISDTHNGHLFSLTYGRFWQIRNLNLHAQVGFRLSSEEIGNYYVGIDPERDTVSQRFPAYSIDSAVKEYKFEVGATYPLSEKWVLRSTVQSYFFSSEVTESPLATDNDSHLLWMTSLSYVF